MLNSLNSEKGGRYGWSIAVHGDYALVGAPRELSERGRAYLYEKNGDNWNHIHTLEPASNPNVDFSGANFGHSVALGSRLSIAFSIG